MKYNFKEVHCTFWHYLIVGLTEAKIVPAVILFLYGCIFEPGETKTTKKNATKEQKKIVTFKIELFTRLIFFYGFIEFSKKNNFFAIL